MGRKSDYEYYYYYEPVVEEPREPGVPRKRGAWIILILATIFALLDALVYIKLYRVVGSLNGDIVTAIKEHVKLFAAFVGFALFYFVLSTISNVKFSVNKRTWGMTFGGVIGRGIIILEYVAYALAIIFLLVQ